MKVSIRRTATLQRGLDAIKVEQCDLTLSSHCEQHIKQHVNKVTLKVS